LLTTDLVRVRRRGGRLEIPPLRDAERARMLAAAHAYVSLAAEHVGETRAQFDEACDDVPHDATDYKLIKGLRKLVHDRCEFAQRDDVDPPALREAVFASATTHRRALADADTFDASVVLKQVARELGASAEAVDEGLYADLKENHVLTDFDAVDAEALVVKYETSSKQAALLRAVRVVVVLKGASAGAYRQFFRQLKFRRLLYTLSTADDGYRLEIDGPFSLFKAVTKYGLQLALLLPALEECGEWTLYADILWGADREALKLTLEGATAAGGAGDAAPLPDDVAQLRTRFAALKSDWDVDPAEELLDLPGIGLCVPDLAFTHSATGQRVYLEVMGYWSRDAVWKRVELVEAGLPYAVVFAVSTRLRVSEDALGDDLPGRIYVYKGVMSAKAVLAQIESASAV
jgi:uncharacterized protein